MVEAVRMPGTTLAMAMGHVEATAGLSSAAWLALVSHGLVIEGKRALRVRDREDEGRAFSGHGGAVGRH